MPSTEFFESSEVNAYSEKRYGRILGRDVQAQIIAFREMSAQGKDIKAQIAKNDTPEFLAELAKAPNWAVYYQESFETVMARFFIMTQSVEMISKLAEQEFPSDTAKLEVDEYFKGKETSEHPQFLSLFFAMQGNIEAITRFSCTMNDLLKRFENDQCIESLAKAASIDTAILSLPASQRLMKFLQFSGKTEALLEFFRFVGKGPHKTREPYQDLRWAEYLLREQKAFDVCSQDEIFDLLVNGLKIYGNDGEHKDSKKALFMLFRKWRKESGN